MDSSGGLASGDQVRSKRFGIGRVEYDKGPTAIVRFDHGLEECAKYDVEVLVTPLQAVEQGRWDAPLEVIVRVQAEAIRSVNDAWGVFSRSKIDLLPHQLWVCRRVLERWPARWLVADDVGLGKTVEAGLILWPLLARGQVRRLLVLCPASLVEQWQSRMRAMFDIRLSPYLAEADTARLDYFATHDQVVASLETVRTFAPEEHTSASRGDRSRRFFSCDPWDLVIVDEAHRLNAEERASPTLGHSLVGRMDEAGLIRSMVFFTGTPHRGKEYGFLSLLKLLRADLFDPDQPMAGQVSRLREVMIRNNKQDATDLGGRRLFQPTTVVNETYSYSSAERTFYETLTDFIVTGKAYAGTLSGYEGSAVGLVLVAMQKLASSSVAAIARALRGRLGRIAEARREVDRLREQLDRYRETEGGVDLDAMAVIEERIASGSANLSLMGGEEHRLRELIAVAERVERETRIERIIALVRSSFCGRSVLFFTEYKATQSLLISALLREFGDGCATFINGDGRADGVIDARGRVVTIREARDRATERFNEGAVRFLVSTEAAGEGIDLQERCHTLVHVDLPWNPMRMHQRVGRLNRIGQRSPVEVVIVRNPDTVEGRIWDRLNAKIESIMRALGGVMEKPEDLMELVLGMASPRLFTELYSEAGSVRPESLEDWFDRKTARFGGRDAIETVRDLVGHCARFNFSDVADQLPRVDLPDLRPFLLNMLALNHRKAREDEEGLSFKTPDDWLDVPGVRRSYEGLVFDRKHRAPDAVNRVAGVGHPAVDRPLLQATGWTKSAALLPAQDLSRPIVVFRVTDRITGSGAQVRSLVFGVESRTEALDATILCDWVLLRRLNEIAKTRTPRSQSLPRSMPLAEAVREVVESSASSLSFELPNMDLPFRFPTLDLLAVLWPEPATSPS
jgi:superfamily II DNA or RNA helicase